MPRMKRAKYGNHKVVYEGIKFDSEKERDRYIFLRRMSEKGEIYALALQVPFELIPKITEDYEVQLKTKTKVKTRTLQQAITYKADFCYHKKDGEFVIEDVKASPKRASLDKVFLLKEKLFFWRFGRKIRKVYDAEEKI